VILRKASLVPYKTTDDLAAIWMGWAEMELRAKQFELARDVLKEATALPPAAQRSKAVEESGPVQGRLYKHTKLWAFYADVLENVGTFDETKAAYVAMLDLRIITPQLVLNFGAFLEEHKHFEDAFQAYERGVAAFKYPFVTPIWLVYLKRFVSRFGGAKLERARDLFEQALDGCPAGESSPLYLLYAQFEEQHGLMRNAMAIYQRAVGAIALDKRQEMYNVYIAKAAEYFGVTKTRDIYESAINDLPTTLVPPMCARYANLERKLGEIDRARAIYMHGAQSVDPSTDATYWDTWHDFEVNHGNEDTFRELLRIKRAVRAVYVQAAVTMPRPGDNKKKREREGQGQAEGEPANSMAALDEEHQRQRQRTDEGTDDVAAAFAEPAPRRLGADAAALGFSAAATFEGARPGFVFKSGELGVGYYRDTSAGGDAAWAQAAGEEIDLDDDEDAPDIEQVQVPAAVFGSAAGEGSGGMGALERFKRAQG